MTWGFIYLGQRSALDAFNRFSYPTPSPDTPDENSTQSDQLSDEWTMPDLEEYNRQLADEWEAPIPGPAPTEDNGEGDIEEYEDVTKR